MFLEGMHQGLLEYVMGITLSYYQIKFISVFVKLTEL